MLQQQLVAPAHPSVLHPVTAVISCSRSRRRRRPRPKPTAFPPPHVRRLVSSLRRLLPRPRPLTVLPGAGGGGWFRRPRKMPSKAALALVLSLALGGDRLARLAEAWNASGLGQMLSIWAALCRGRGRRGGGLRRLAPFLLGVAFCALVYHFRGAALLEGLRKTGGGRKLVRILLR